jgi:hypothetical protein
MPCSCPFDGADEVHSSAGAIDHRHTRDAHRADRLRVSADPQAGLERAQPAIIPAVSVGQTAYHRQDGYRSCYPYGSGGK